MNKFPINISGKEYIFTVNRRTNLLANQSDSKQFELLDLGLTFADINEMQGVKSPEKMIEILKRRNIPMAKFSELTNSNDFTKYEEMFYQCIKIEHPEFSDRELALQLFDKMEEEYGMPYIIEAFNEMSIQVFTMNENSKKIDWLESKKNLNKVISKK